MPEGREYVVVTRARMALSRRWITHVYGPYGQAKAKSVKSNIKQKHANDFNAPDSELEVSVCHVLDPESWNQQL